MSRGAGWQGASPRRRAAVVVASAHVLLVAAWWTAARLVAVAPAMERISWLRLVAPDRPKPQAEEKPREARPAARRPAPVITPALPTPPTTGWTPSLPASTPLPAEPVAPPPAPLQLTLSKEQLRAFVPPPALADAYRKVVAQHGERVAQAIGRAIGYSDRMSVEDLGNGNWRVREGGSCVLMHDTAMSKLDPIRHGNDFKLEESC